MVDPGVLRQGLIEIVLLREIWFVVLLLYIRPWMIELLLQWRTQGWKMVLCSGRAPRVLEYLLQWRAEWRLVPSWR